MMEFQPDASFRHLTNASVKNSRARSRLPKQFSSATNFYTKAPKRTFTAPHSLTRPVASNSGFRFPFTMAISDAQSSPNDYDGTIGTSSNAYHNYYEPQFQRIQQNEYKNKQSESYQRKFLK
jgi:hypothetical protein